MNGWKSSTIFAKLSILDVEKGSKYASIIDIEDVLDDKTFERGILASNRFYEIVCEDETDPDNECKLEEIKEYTGKVPSKKWLGSNKVCEFYYLLGI